MKQNMPFLRTPYNYDRDQASQESGLTCKDESLTVQSQAADTDINNIMKKYVITGLMPHVDNPPTYGDFNGIDNYQDALHLVRQAQESFNQLPADLRRKLDYDPGKFIEYAEDPANLEEMRKLGLARAITQQDAPRADNATPPGTPPKGG